MFAFGNLGNLFVDMDALHARQPSNRSWKKKFTNGKRLIKTIAPRHSSVK